MKLVLYLILTLLSYNVFCQNIDFEREKSILVLQYIQKNIEEFDEIDDFSQYYHLAKAFYFDGELNLSQEDRILLEIYGNNQVVRDFPFTYSHLRIDSISNDTIVHFTVNGKNFFVCPNENYEDSLQILKYQTCLFKSRVFDNRNRAEKEIEFRLDAPIFADSMPRFIHNGEGLDIYLKSYGIKICNENSINNAFLQIVLDEHGNITFYTLYRRVESDAITSKIIKAFDEMPKWIPAKNGDKNVPIKLIFELNKE